ncbi:Clp protease N-terminal domain-containing protein [Pseudoduganella sp.]|uniref:Clp protease N-terminal domain-containing protein n=1 Tax=Pseudoduganella sp. TaxID=1880898 RepID=UPI0035B21B69
MFSTLKRRLGDMATIKTLCTAAERHANAAGQQQPGAEHFVLAALELPDGSAAAALRRLQAEPSAFRAAVEQQYADALAGLGVAGASLPPPAPVAASDGLYRAGASGQALLQALAALDKAGRPLLGAHVLLAASAAQQGVTARALRAMGLTPAQLAQAAQQEAAARA